MVQKTIHLIVEQGPDQGLEITVPRDGARVGRSSKNDIALKDPAMSRFHCRFFFKPGEGLWAQDLGSANQTQINQNLLREARVNIGDRITMGDTVLKVIGDQLGDIAAAPLFDQTQATKAPPGTPPGKPPGKIEFRRAPPGVSAEQRRLALLIAVLVLMAMAAAVIWVAKKHTHRTPVINPRVKAQVETLEIAFEKVQAGAQNIFRYEMELKDNTLSIQIDDLQNNRHVAKNQHKKVDPELIQSLTATLIDSDFFALKDEYKGLPAEVWDQLDLSVTIGRRTKRIKVLNTIEPEQFKSVREAIEEFGKNELGLAALALPPEKLLEMAQSATLLGRGLYDQREVKNENLALAIRSLKEAEWYLETIEPKPDFYADAVALRAECERELKAVYNQHDFLAERAIKLEEWAAAAAQLRIICEKFPDRSSEQHQNARKKLIDVERHLKKK